MGIFFGGNGDGEDGQFTDFATTDTQTIRRFLGFERRLRALREEIFDGRIVNEASWHLLQDLLAADLEGKSLRVNQLQARSALPQTTVLRYLDHLEAFKLIDRGQDPDDHRATLIQLTPVGRRWMHEYYAQVDLAERNLEDHREGVLGAEQEPPGREKK